MGKKPEEIGQKRPDTAATAEDANAQGCKQTIAQMDGTKKRKGGRGGGGTTKPKKKPRNPNDLAKTWHPKSNAYNPNPGQTSAEELELRVAVVIKLMQKGWRKWAIKRRVKEMFQVSSRTVENYLSRARDEMREETGKSRSEHVEDLYAVLSGIIEDPDSTKSEVVRAVREMRSLLLLSGDRWNSAAVLNQQFNVGVSVQGDGEGAGDGAGEEEFAIGELDLESRRTQICALADRLRTRAVSAGAGEPGGGGIGSAAG